MDKICKKWNKDKTKNPETGRAIKKDGPTYNKLKEKCEKQNKKSKTTKKKSPKKVSPKKVSHKKSSPKKDSPKKKSSKKLDCNKWIQDWQNGIHKNPETGRAIKKDGPVYKKLVNECGSPEKKASPKKQSPVKQKQQSPVKKEIQMLNQNIARLRRMIKDNTDIPEIKNIEDELNELKNNDDVDEKINIVNKLIQDVKTIYANTEKPKQKSPVKQKEKSPVKSFHKPELSENQKRIKDRISDILNELNDKNMYEAIINKINDRNLTKTVKDLAKIRDDLEVILDEKKKRYNFFEEKSPVKQKEKSPVKQKEKSPVKQKPVKYSVKELDESLKNIVARRRELNINKAFEQVMEEMKDLNQEVKNALNFKLGDLLSKKGSDVITKLEEIHNQILEFKKQQNVKSNPLYEEKLKSFQFIDDLMLMDIDKKTRNELVEIRNKIEKSETISELFENKKLFKEWSKQNLSKHERETQIIRKLDEEIGKYMQNFGDNHHLFNRIEERRRNVKNINELKQIRDELKRMI